MYFFDIEDYAGTNREKFNADIKANSGGLGVVHCGRPIGHTKSDTITTAKATSDAFFKHVSDWFSASTITIGNSTNTLARNIFYNEFIPNYNEYLINFAKYTNQILLTRKEWESKCVDNVYSSAIINCASFEDTWQQRVNTYNDDVLTGTTTIYIKSANTTTNTITSTPTTIVYPQFSDWNDSYYYNHNNSLRKLMGSLKRLMQAIDNDTFDDII